MLVAVRYESHLSVSHVHGRAKASEHPDNGPSAVAWNTMPVSAWAVAAKLISRVLANSWENALGADIFTLSRSDPESQSVHNIPAPVLGGKVANAF